MSFVVLLGRDKVGGPKDRDKAEELKFLNPGLQEIIGNLRPEKEMEKPKKEGFVSSIQL